MKTYRDLKLTEEEASLVLSNPYRETEILGEGRGYIFWCLYISTIPARCGLKKRAERVITSAVVVKAKPGARLA